MQEGFWDSAVKNLENAMNINRLPPDYHFAIALCFIELGRIKDAVIHFTHFIKARPKNVKGWKELIRCLYEAEYFEEALEQVYNAQKNTDNKPLFTYFKSAILFELGKSKEALLLLQIAIHEAPGMVRQFIDLNPSLLQHPAVSDMISNYKNSIKRKKK